LPKPVIFERSRKKERSMKRKRQKALLVLATWLALKAVTHVLRGIAVRSVKQINKDSFPKTGALLIPINHFAGKGEEFGILIQQLGRKIYFVYKSDLEKGLLGPFVRLFLRGVGIPTKRGKRGEGVEAEEKIKAVLEEDSVVAAAPEGTSRHKGLIRARRRGIGRIAVELDCPVLPVAIHNANGALVNGLLSYPRLTFLGFLFRGKRRQDIKVIFGALIKMSELRIDFKDDPEELQGQAATDAMMIRVGAMLPLKDRGEYEEDINEFLEKSNAPDADFYRKLQLLVNPTAGDN
jgi:1-acyl-sn-glycerol-3-phosphate acyltransferase